MHGKDDLKIIKGLSNILRAEQIFSNPLPKLFSAMASGQTAGAFCESRN